MNRLGIVVVVSVVAASLAFAGGYFWNARQAVSQAEAQPPAPTRRFSTATLS